MGAKKSGRRWILTGIVWKGERQLKVEERSIDVHSEDDLDRHEAKMRAELAHHVMTKLKDMKDVRVEIESDLE